MSTVVVPSLKDLLAEYEALPDDREARHAFAVKHRKSPAIVGAWEHHSGRRYYAGQLGFCSDRGQPVVLYASPILGDGAAYSRLLTEWAGTTSGGLPKFVRLG